MSTEITLYPSSATKQEIKKHLLSLGYMATNHLWNWPKGSLNFGWFEAEDFKSIDGVEATIYPPSETDQQKFGKCDWALHTRTRASASVFDKEFQNETIRTARRLFGGKFYNDWHGVNRYAPPRKDPRGPAGRGVYLSYEFVRHHHGAVKYALAQTLQAKVTGEGKVQDFLRQQDPNRILHNALVPFAVAGLEHFFGQTFRILLHYDPQAQQRLRDQTRKIEIHEALAISRGERSIEDVVADWYSFQNIQSINSAFREWFQIDIWKLLRKRKRIGRSVGVLERRLTNLIEFRHGVIHRFEFDLTLTRERIFEFFDTAEVVIDAFVDYLERERGIKIRD